MGKAKQAQPILEATARELRDRSKYQAIDVIELTWGGGGLNIVFGACRELQP